MQPPIPRKNQDATFKSIFKIHTALNPNKEILIYSIEKW